MAFARQILFRMVNIVRPFALLQRLHMLSGLFSNLAIPSQEEVSNAVIQSVNVTILKANTFHLKSHVLHILFYALKELQLWRDSLLLTV